MMARVLTPKEQDALNKVRRRVAVIVFLVVTMHAILALIGLSRYYDDHGRQGDATALLVMSGFISAFQYVGARVILGKPIWSWVWIPVAALATTFGFLLR